MKSTEKIHQGKNMKRFREMLGIKQEALSYQLGEDWTQKKVSLLETKDEIENFVLEKVAKILKITPEAIKNYNEEAVLHIINNTFIEGTPLADTDAGSINPLEKIIELYERLIQAEKEKVSYLENMLTSKR